MGIELQVIGKKEPGYLIKRKLRIGQDVTIRHSGKVERCIVIRTKRYTPTNVSFDKPAVMIKGFKAKAKGPISKGLNQYADLLALSGGKTNCYSSILYT